MKENFGRTSTDISFDDKEWKQIHKSGAVAEQTFVSTSQFNDWSFWLLKTVILLCRTWTGHSKIKQEIKAFLTPTKQLPFKLMFAV